MATKRELDAELRRRGVRFNPRAPKTELEDLLRAVKAAEVAEVEQGNTEVQAAVDEASEPGYVGYNPDPTPNDHYTLSGVVDGLPTPESDREAAQAVTDEAARRAAELRHEEE